MLRQCQLKLKFFFPSLRSWPLSQGDVADNLTEGLKNLFIEVANCNVIFEDCTEAPTIWTAMPGDALNNWACNPSTVLRKSW
ncbi:hypothetical protein H5410_027205 [Solanum commersonii]|uniref:Uncharacterized protein n=1 Tax=Solanum commersonii TaxID=4109 RepID=A0A9J5YYL3_SOLCO|nr:hypothetical protein H5410_027205 [Solanum commersonii]